MEDYYEILEVSQQATFAEIKTAYRSLCKEYHPDKLPLGTPEKARKHIEERFKQISHAYSVISNPETRQAYDLNHADRLAADRNQNSPTNQSNTIFEPEKLKKATERLEVLRNNIELEFQETQIEVDRVVNHQIKSLGLKEEDLRGSTVIGKIGNSLIALFIFSSGIGWMALGNVLSFLLGISLSGCSLIFFLRKLSSPTLSIKNARKINLIEQRATEKKLNARKKRQKQLDDLKKYQQQRIEFFKSIPIFMLSEDYIATLTEEDQLYLLQCLDRRNDTAQLAQNVKTVAQVAIGVGLLAILVGLK